MTETKPKRRWFRFSLRTLFVLVTIIGIAAGWVTYQLNWIRERHSAGKWVVQNYDVAWGNRLVSPPLALRLYGESPSFHMVIRLRKTDDLKPSLKPRLNSSMTFSSRAPESAAKELLELIRVFPELRIEFECE